MLDFFEKYKAYELLYNNSKDSSQGKFSRFILYYIGDLILMIAYLYSIYRESYDIKVYIPFCTICVVYVMLVSVGKSVTYGRYLKIDSSKAVLYQYLYNFLTFLIMISLLFVIQLIFNFLDITIREFICFTLLTLNYFNFLMVVFYEEKFHKKIALVSILVMLMLIVLINYFKDSYFILVLVIANLISFFFNIMCMKYIINAKNYTK